MKSVCVLLILFLCSCKSEEEKQAEKTVDNYAAYVDSVSSISAENVRANWYEIDAGYRQRMSDVQAAMATLQNPEAAEKRVYGSKAKYEEWKAKYAVEMKAHEIETGHINRPKSVEYGTANLDRFEYESIPATFSIKDSTGREKLLDKKALGLPEHYTSRMFLRIVVGSTDDEGIKKLVGCVVKKSTIDGKEYYDDTTRNFKAAAAKMAARKLENGTVIENRYNKEIGAGISFLIGNADFTRDVAYEVLINDVYTASITDDDIDKQKLYDAYGKDADLDNYYVVMAATSTSLLYKIFEKSSKKGDFAYIGVKVNGSYYKDNKQVMQDWKVGTKAVSVRELLRGFTPKK